MRCETISAWYFPRGIQRTYVSNEFSRAVLDVPFRKFEATRGTHSITASIFVPREMSSPCRGIRENTEYI